MGRGGQLAAKGGETFLHRGEGQAIQQPPGHQKQIAAGGQELLVAAKDLAQATFGAVAPDGIADGGGGGDDPDAAETHG